MEKLKRYLIFLIGLFINSLGVSLITKADLGTSPISSVPYVLSLNFPFTLGQFTIVFSLVLILIQFLILRKNFRLEHLLQIPVSVLFGYFIDLLTAKINRQYFRQNRPACPGSIRSACSKSGSQDSSVQIGVFRQRIPRPMGNIFSP